MRRTALFLALLVASTAVAALALPAAAQPPPPAPAPTLRWSPCHQDLGPFECATLQVPLDYDQPGRNPVRIGLVRLPATSPEERIGSLLFNPGGPGGSGVEFILLAGQFLYSDEVRARFDMVGFDPRGIMTSSPLRCFRSLDQAINQVGLPFAFPVTDRGRSGVRRDRHPARRLLRPQRRADPRPHGHRGRRQGHGPDPPGARRRPAQLRRVLVRVRAGGDLRQHVPRPGPGGCRRRRRRSDRLDHRRRERGGDPPHVLPAAQRRRRPGHPRRVLPAVRREPRRLRLRRWFRRPFRRHRRHAAPGRAGRGDRPVHRRGDPLRLPGPHRGDAGRHVQLLRLAVPRRVPRRPGGGGISDDARRLPAGRVGEHRHSPPSRRRTPTSSRASSEWHVRTRTTPTTIRSGRRLPTTPRPASATSGGSGPGSRHRARCGAGPMPTGT